MTGAIPADHISFNDDGTAWLVFDDDSWRVAGGPYWWHLDRPCDHCKNDGPWTIDCGCIDGRHTFTIEVGRPANGWHPERDGDPDCKCSACTGEACWQYHPFGGHCDHDSIDRHDGKECDDPEFRTYRVSVVPGMVLPIYADFPGYDVPQWIDVSDYYGDGVIMASLQTQGLANPPFITLPPAAAPGMYAVKLKVAS